MTGPRRSLHGWSLRRRFTVAVVLAGAMVSALGVVVAVTFVEVGDTQARVTQTFYSAVRQSSSLFTAYLDQETGVRGYLLTSDERFLTPYSDGLGEEDRAVTELRRLLAHDPALLAELADLHRDGRAWRDGYATAVVDQVRAGRAQTVTAEQQAAGQRLFDRLRRSDDAFQRTLQAARAAAVEDLGRGRAVLGLAFGALALLVLVALVGLGLALRRWILEPLDAVRADVGAVADGDLDHEVTSSGPPDLHAVAADVERMRRRLRRAYAQQVATTRTLERQREQLEQQTDDLRRSNAELEQFAYVASHDLQEPLRKVASFTELLQRRYGGQLDERADTYIAFAVDGAHRMQGLINDLLAFSRVGRVGVTRTEVPLAAVLRRAQDDLSGAAEEAGAVVEVVEEDGAVPLPTVTGDAGLLTQVFQNLLGNAIKFRRPGVPPRVRISCRPDDGGTLWRIDVTDNGIGIAPEYADRVFVVFSRLNRREDYPGTGIGLALAKKIVEYHGGTIRLGTAPGPGTTISFTLPATAGTGEGGPA